MTVVSGTNSFTKDMAIRKRIASIYNKREEDFPSLREYNDYLEEIEDMIVNLTEGIDAPAVEARIAQYQKENVEQIMNAQACKAEEYAAALSASRRKLVKLSVDDASISQSGISGGAYTPSITGSVIGHPCPSGMTKQPLPVRSGLNMMGVDYEDEEKMMKLRAEKAARPGGWSEEMSKKRERKEAFASIWI